MDSLFNLSNSIELLKIAYKTKYKVFDQRVKKHSSISSNFLCTKEIGTLSFNNGLFVRFYYEIKFLNST